MKKVVKSFRLTQENADRVERSAFLRGVSQADVVNEILEQSDLEPLSTKAMVLRILAILSK